MQDKARITQCSAKRLVPGPAAETFHLKNGCQRVIEGEMATQSAGVKSMQACATDYYKASNS